MERSFGRQKKIKGIFNLKYLCDWCSVLVVYLVFIKAQRGESGAVAQSDDPRFNFDLIQKSELLIRKNPQIKGQNPNP